MTVPIAPVAQVSGGSSTRSGPGTIVARSHWLTTKEKQRYAERVRRSVTPLLRSLGFERTKSTYWTRCRPQVVEFIHLHLYSFAPAFRVHTGIRALNDPFEAIALNGPDSHARRYLLEFTTADASVERCARDVLEFCTEVAEPWFKAWRHRGARAPERRSRSDNEVADALGDALRGKPNAMNVARTRALLGLDKTPSV